jgi:WhiB family redox-sensing transcriptional regulator
LTDWAESANCLGENMAHFFPDDESAPRGGKKAYVMGKAICAQCSVKDECLSFALITETTHGLFGGLTPLERKKLVIRTRLGV